MNLWAMLGGELLFRKTHAALALLAVVVASGSMIGAVTLLHVHDIHTETILQQKEEATRRRLAVLQDEIRKATLKLKFNLLILPKNANVQDWYADDFADQYMPEEYVHRLAKSGIVTVNHYLPTLQRKIRWPEQNDRLLILVGTRGEVPIFLRNPSKPLLQQVPDGTIVLGHELHRSLGLLPGGKVRLLGREFKIHTCHEERGSKDDITAWIPLRDAQELFDKQGLINAILALECMCAPDGIASVRRDVASVLPDTQVIEFGSKALARYEARSQVGVEARAALQRERDARDLLKIERERLAAILVPVILVACMLWIAILGFSNVRARRDEIGVLRAIGFRSRHILLLFLSKSLLLGLLGGAIGLAAGLLAGLHLGVLLESRVVNPVAAGLLSPRVGILALVATPLLTTAAGWLPAMLAARQNPADILHRE